jgi:glycosyltransferase involved in cell wall biosynthesis
MNNPVRISIIIPTYNRCALLLEAVGSALAEQSAGIEVIVVDDGSADGTGTTPQARYGSSVSYIYQERAGRSSARNRGILSASGKYVVFLDSDDLLLEGGLEIRAQHLDAHPQVDVVSCDGYYCDARGNVLSAVSSGHPPVLEDRILETLVLHNVIAAPHLAMVRRSTLEKFGCPVFDENLHGMEDADLWIRLSARGAKFKLIPAYAGKYRLHGAGNESSPHSPNRPKREESVRRFKYKVFESSYFPELPIAVRQEFIRQFLLNTLSGRKEEQQAVLNHPHLQALPGNLRAPLFYFVGQQTITHGGDMVRGRECLRQAAMLDPRNFKYRLVRTLSHAGRGLFRMVIALRRAAGRLTKRPDLSIAPHWR